MATNKETHSFLQNEGKKQDKAEDFCLILTEMYQTFKKKNADYGNSATQTFKEYGLTAYAIRLTDKLNRLKAFCANGGKLSVQDEAIKDTLKDMASYCVLAILDIDKEK